MDKNKVLLLIVFVFVIVATTVDFDTFKSKKGDRFFYQGRGRVVSGKYSEAIPLLGKYMDHYPSGRFASRAGLFLGKAYLALGNREKAGEIWARVVQKYPRTLEGHKCRYKLAFLYMLNGERDKAIEAFGKLADSPDGPLAPEAGAMRDYLQGEPLPAEKLPSQ